MVQLFKPAHCREAAFTDKTGGCKCEARTVERTLVYRPAVRWETWASGKVTGGADFHCNTTCEYV